MSLYSFSSNKSGSAKSTAAKTKLYTFSKQPTLTPEASIYANKNVNNGGILGGIGYVGEKIGLGALQGVEGAIDFTTGGVAKLLGLMGVEGANEFAENTFATDWLNYNHADDWYNPSEGWKVAGDVGSGIGTTLLASGTTAAVAFATGGASLIPTVAGLAVTGLSAAGTSTKEAYMESGNLGGKEFAYGTVMGGVEAGMEAIGGKILGTGVSKVADAAKSLLGKSAKTVAKSGAKAFAIDMAKEFGSEAFEEGFSTFISPWVARATYDPNAENATAEEIAYSALVGGLSGVVMGGTTTGIVHGARTLSGTIAEKQGKTGTIMREAEVLSEEGATTSKTAEAIRETYGKLKDNIDNGGNKVNRRRLLGELNSYNKAAVALSGMVKRSGISTINNAEAVAQKLATDGRYKIIDDKFTFVEDASKIPEGATVRDVTAEDITKGYNANAKDGIGEALKSNEILRYIAASDAAGRFMMGAKEIEAAALKGEQVRTEAEYNRLREEATAEERRAIANEIGVEDINTTSFEDFNAAVQSYKESGKADSYVKKAAKIEEMKKLSETKAKSIPKAIALADGNIQHYADTNIDIVIARDGDSFIVYDYKTGNYTRSMTRAEVNAMLAKNRVADVTNTFSQQKATESDIEAESDAKAEATKLDNLAKEKIKDYDHLSKANRLMVRDVIREALNKGLSEADALTYARVSARTGLDISFDKQACYKGKNEAGEAIYHAGYYDPDTNKIVVNPDTKKKHTALLIHELSHATRAYLGKDNKIHYIFDDKAYMKLSEDMQKRIAEYYADQDTDVSKAELMLDEATAYYAETLFGTERAIELMLGEKPTLKEKILSFFKGAAKDYATDPKLAREARKQLKAFTKLFNNFSARNFGKNAESGEASSKVNRRASFSSIAYSFFGNENMTSEEFVSHDYKNTDGYKQYVEQSVANMKQSRKGMTEAAIRKEVEKSIDGIVQVAVAMKRAGYDIHDNSQMRNAKDTKNRLLFSSLEPNSDYFTSSDISTICDKRKNFAEIYDDIVKEEERLGVPENKRFFKNVDNYFYIHKVLADKGLTQPCRECYVESMRKNLAPMANAFLELIRETDDGNTKNKQLYDKGKLKTGNAEKRIRVLELLDEYNKSANDITIEMLSTEDGLAQMKLQMPELYEVFNSFYGQSKPKMPKGATPFRFGELSALLTDEHGKIKTKLVDQIESTGGFRLQSYSDFQIQNFVDVLQVIYEAGTLGLTGHAYTKVPAFLDATKGTNLKRNISVFMYKDGNNWRVDRNDSFPYSLEEMYQLERDDKSGNTGIIVVSQNADNSAWIMANDLIAYGIPFHKSGLKMGVVRETIVREGGREIKGYQNIKDHTKQQSEVYARTEGDHKALNKVKKGINIYEFWDFDNKRGLSKNKLIEKNLKAYINKCEELGYLPKFREYVMDNAAVLNATLKYAKELGTVGKDATIDDISFKYKGYTIPYGYYKFLGDFSMFNTDGKASSHEVLSLANYDFDEAIKYFSNAEQLRRKEILQQFANGEERQKYANSTLNAEELTQIVEGKRKEVVNEIVYRSKGNIRAAMEENISDNKSTAYVKAKDVKAENLIEFIATHKDLDYRLGEFVSPKFEKAIKRYGNLAHSRLYRGMEAAELDFIIENGYIKSNSSYNFADQQGQTRLAPDIKTAYSYATHFAPTEIRKKFFEDGMPSYIVEIANFEDLGIVNEDNIESYTTKEIDKKYITRIIELTYDAKSEEVRASDITIDGMNNAKGKIHGVPEFVRDKVTGTILFKHQDENGIEDGKYISEKNPDMLFDYKMVKEFEGKDFDFNAYIGISGKESDLEPFTYPTKKYDESVENVSDLGYNKGDLFDPYSIKSSKIVKNLPHDFLRMLANKTSDMSDGETRIVYVSGYIFEANGYMQGDIISLYNNNTKKLLKGKESSYEQFNSDREITVLWSETVQNAKGGSSSNGSISQRSKSNADDKLLGITSHSEVSRDNERVRQTTEATESKVNKRASMDIDYLDAVNRGDMVTAQRMVDEAAETAGAMVLKSGTTKHYYHGTDAKFTSFAAEKARDGTYGFGFYFSPMKSKASQYGELKDVYLMTNRIATRLSHSITADQVNAFLEKYDIDLNSTILKYADSIEAWIAYKDDMSIMLDLERFVVSSMEVDIKQLLYDLVETFDYDGVRQTNETVLWDNRLIKSADTVTYDDNGKVIPLSERFNSKSNDIRYSMDIDIEASRSSIVMDMDKRYKPTKREAISDTATQFQIQFTNQQAGIEKVLKKNGYKAAEALVQRARAAVNAADSMIGLEQYRIGAENTKDIVKVGEGLSQIMKPIENATAIKDELKSLSKAEAEAKKQEYVSDFFTYLFHMHNIDRMSLKSKSEAELAALQSDVDFLTEKVKDLTQKLQGATDKKEIRNALLKTKAKLKEAQQKVNNFEVLEDKPVIGRAVDAQGNTVITTVDDADGYKVIPFTADESKAISDELLKRHPEFAKSAEGIWNYSKNLNQYRVDTGLITKEAFDRMQELYPHYVPTYREGSASGIAALKGKYDVAVKSTVKGAKGSVRPLLRPDVIIARQTEETVKAGAVNKLASTLYDVAANTADVSVVSRSKAGMLVDYDPTQDKPKNNQVTFYKDGEKITMQVTSEVFEGFDGFNSQTSNVVVSTATAVNNLFKKLVTSYSPLFILRNAVRDLQDAGINTKYGRSFIKNYGVAFKEIQTNGKLWQLYRAMGGLNSSLFDFDKGYSTTANKKGLPSKQGLKKILQSVENANVVVEQLPRLAEFISAINAGKSADQAILDAADVTTNFGRSGKLVRKLNKTFVPFLNPSVQGFSKIVRNVNDARKSVKGIITLLIKCILIGMVPMAINSLIYDDDEDYAQLRENDKENNYLIKLPNGTFIKIPRGRVASVLAGAYNRTSQVIKGEDVDWGEYLENVSTQVSPVDGGVPRDILSPIRDVLANKTWYGTDIENQSDELVAPGERYDESTSAIAKTVGGILNISPKKINYLIDQYTGVAGDLILPTTSNKANKGYILGNTTIDPTTQNKLSSSFYDALDQATYVKNSKSGKYTETDIAEAEAVYKYLNDIKSKVNELNKAKREINNSSEFSNSDKLARINDIQILINEYYKQALTDMSAFAAMYSTTDDIAEDGIYAGYIATGVEEDTIKTLRYTETLRQLYGAEQALSEYNKTVYEKSAVYNSLGLSYDKFYDFYFTTRGLESDVDKDGETVSGSKRKKVVKALKKTKATKSEKVLMMYLAGYTVQDGDIAGVSASSAKRLVLNAIMKLDVSKEEKAEIAKNFGFKVKNGRIIKDF